MTYWASSVARKRCGVHHTFCLEVFGQELLAPIQAAPRGASHWKALMVTGKRICAAVERDRRWPFSRKWNLYKEGWCQKLQWQRNKSFLTWPEEPAETLYNSDALRSASRSPAVDFWKERAPKLSGYRNYYKVSVRTDGQKATVDKNGLTTFWVMRQSRQATNQSRQGDACTGRHQKRHWRSDGAFNSS